MGTEWVPETSENLHILTRLSARENSTDVSSHVGKSTTRWIFATIWWTYFVHVTTTIHTVIRNGQFIFLNLQSLLFDFVSFHRQSRGDNTHANWSKDCRRQSQCKSLRLVGLSRCYVCLTQNCTYFAWFQLTLSGGSRLIAPKLVTTLLRVTASVWNVLQSATTAAIITPPQRRPTDWKVSVVTISCVLANNDEVRSILRSCRNWIPYTPKRTARVFVLRKRVAQE